MSASIQQALQRAKQHRLRGRVCTTMTFETGDLIHREGDEASTLYTINSGAVLLTRVGGDGEERATGLLIAGDMFGDVFAPDGVYLCTATALSDLTLNAIGYDRLRVEDAPYLLLNLSQRYQRQLEYSSRLATGSIRVRVCEILMRLLASDLAEAKEDGMFAVKITQQQLALLAHTRRESVAKTLGELQSEDVLVRGYTSLVVMDALKLVEIAEGFED